MGEGQELKGTKHNINPIQVAPRFVNDNITIATPTSLDTSDIILIDVHGTLSFSDVVAGTYIEVTGYTIQCADMDSIWIDGATACDITKYKGIEDV